MTRISRRFCGYIALGIFISTEETMAARDRYSYNVKCPQCGQLGVFHVSEDDHPYMKNPHKSVDEIDGDFSASVDRGIEVTATCKQCNTTFEPKG